MYSAPATLIPLPKMHCNQLLSETIYSEKNSLNIHFKGTQYGLERKYWKSKTVGVRALLQME